MKENIVLCGFMGSGKSVTGKLLAEKLGFNFFDLDHVIEQAEQMTISEIFEKHGEAEFRKMETKAARKLGNLSGAIIACGGGTVLKQENITALKKNGKLFFLEVSPETVLERLAKDTSRPLLRAEDKEARIQNLLTARTPLYHAAADFVINANQSKEAVAENILKTLCKDSQLKEK